MAWKRAKLPENYNYAEMTFVPITRHTFRWDNLASIQANMCKMIQQKKSAKWL